MFPRAYVWQQGLPRKARAGDGWCSAIKKIVQATDSAQVIDATGFGGGVYIRSGLTTGRTDTTDTAANLAAANGDMNVGDSVMMLVGNTTASTLTIAGGTGVTASGNLLVLTLTSKWFILTMTASGASPTFDLVGL